MSCWGCLLKPEFEHEGKMLPIPVQVIPKLSEGLAHRLHLGRKRGCPRVDRRTSDWSHRENYSWRDKCACISQKDVAKVFQISQETLSRFERYRKREVNFAKWMKKRRTRRPMNLPKHIDLTAFLTVFGVETTFWILTGVELNKNKGLNNDDSGR